MKINRNNSLINGDFIAYVCLFLPTFTSNFFCKSIFFFNQIKKNNIFKYPQQKKLDK